MLRLSEESTHPARVRTIATDRSCLQVAQHALGLTIDINASHRGVDGTDRREYAHTEISLPDAVRLVDELSAAIDAALSRDPRQLAIWGSTRRALAERCSRRAA